MLLSLDRLIVLSIGIEMSEEGVQRSPFAALKARTAEQPAAPRFCTHIVSHVSLFALCATGCRLEAPKPAQFILPFFPCCREGGVCATGCHRRGRLAAPKVSTIYVDIISMSVPVLHCVLMSC